MKKIILIALFVFGININLSADYISGFAQCKHSTIFNGKTIFIVKGKGSKERTSTLAMAAFLNAEYSHEITKYCKSDTIYSNGYIYSFKTKSGANKHFTELINDYKNESYIEKIILIKNGYDEDDWR